MTTQDRKQIPVLKRSTDESGKRRWVPHLFGKPVGHPCGYRTKREAVHAANVILGQGLVR